MFRSPRFRGKIAICGRFGGYANGLAATLEMWCPGNRVVGSSPMPSAFRKESLKGPKSPVEKGFSAFCFRSRHPVPSRPPRRGNEGTEGTLWDNLIYQKALPVERQNNHPDR